MLLFHGTSSEHVDSLRRMRKGTWFTAKRYHALKLADRTSERDGGDPMIMQVEVPDSLVERVSGRKIPSFRLLEDYSPVWVKEFIICER